MNTEPELPPGKIIARVAAGSALTIAAGHSAESFDKFALWFLAAFCAGLALIVSHLKEVSVFIPLSTIASASYLFLFATVVCAAQRYVAMTITSGAAAAKDGREMGDKLQYMDCDEFIAQMLQGVPWPMHAMCKQMFDALAKGDHAVGGRLFMRLAMLHAVLVSIEFIILLVALAKIINAIKA